MRNEVKFRNPGISCVDHEKKCPITGTMYPCCRNGGTSEKKQTNKLRFEGNKELGKRINFDLSRTYRKGDVRGSMNRSVAQEY